MKIHEKNRDNKEWEVNILGMYCALVPTYSYFCVHFHHILVWNTSACVYSVLILMLMQGLAVQWIGNLTKEVDNQDDNWKG